MSKLNLMPQTPSEALVEAKACLEFISQPGVSDNIAQGQLMIAIENLMYMFYWAGGNVAELTEGVVYEMFEEGYVDMLARKKQGGV